MKITGIQNYQYSPNFNGSKDKFIQKILQADNIKKIKILSSDVERICESLGFERNKKRGSHMTFKISDTENMMIVAPHNNKNEISHTDKVKFQKFLQKYYKKSPDKADKTESENQNSLDVII